MIEPHEAVSQAMSTASDYAWNAIYKLCDHLQIDRDDPKWREQLAPFAVVLAAMVEASAKDFDTAMRSGVVRHVTNWRDLVEDISGRLGELTDVIRKNGNGRD